MEEVNKFIQERYNDDRLHLSYSVLTSGFSRDSYTPSHSELIQRKKQKSNNFMKGGRTFGQSKSEVKIRRAKSIVG